MFETLISFSIVSDLWVLLRWYVHPHCKGVLFRYRFCECKFSQRSSELPTMRILFARQHYYPTVSLKCLQELFFEAPAAAKEVLPELFLIGCNMCLIWFRCCCTILLPFIRCPDIPVSVPAILCAWVLLLLFWSLTFASAPFGAYFTTSFCRW